LRVLACSSSWALMISASASSITHTTMQDLGNSFRSALRAAIPSLSGLFTAQARPRQPHFPTYIGTWRNKRGNVPVSSFQTTASSVNLPRLWYALGTSPADERASEEELMRSSIRASRGLTLQLIACDVHFLEA
jgi:hypothetical protein